MAYKCKKTIIKRFEKDKKTLSYVVVWCPPQPWPMRAPSAPTRSVELHRSLPKPRRTCYSRGFMPHVILPLMRSNHIVWPVLFTCRLPQRRVSIFCNGIWLGAARQQGRHDVRMPDSAVRNGVREALQIFLQTKELNKTDAIADSSADTTSVYRGQAVENNISNVRWSSQSNVVS